MAKRISLLERKSAELQEVSSVEIKRFNSSHHLITLGAFRYALGRRSYFVGEIIEWLQTYWSEIDPKTKDIIIQEAEQAVMLGCAGDECDKESWERFLDFAHKTVKFL